MALAELTLNALPVVQAFNAALEEDARFGAACDRSRRAELGAVKVEALLSRLIEAAVATGTLALVVVGALEMRRGALTLSTLAAFLGAVASAQRVAALLCAAST